MFFFSLLPIISMFFMLVSWLQLLIISASYFSLLVSQLFILRVSSLCEFEINLASSPIVLIGHPDKSSTLSSQTLEVRQSPIIITLLAVS